jgi:hypothetical protein
MAQEHGLEVPLGYLLIVEGTGDIEYLNAAVDRVKRDISVDLLALDGKHRSSGEITICSPRNPEFRDVHRGGTPQMQRLAKAISDSVLRFEVPSPICFLLDHDSAGKEASEMIDGLGFKSDSARSITLDPACHSNASKGRRGDVVIEDLVALELHEQCFRDGRHDCVVTYTTGKATRYEWHEASKEQFRKYVVAHAARAHLRELVRVLVRVRRLWRLQTPPGVCDFADACQQTIAIQ